MVARDHDGGCDRIGADVGDRRIGAAVCSGCFVPRRGGYSEHLERIVSSAKERDSVRRFDVWTGVLPVERDCSDGALCFVATPQAALAACSRVQTCHSATGASSSIAHWAG